MANIPAFQAGDASSILATRTKNNVANVAHLVRASGCGSEGSGFDPHRSPQINTISLVLIVLILVNILGIESLT